MTKELLYEVAANALIATVSGGHLEGVGSCDGLKPHGTGLEARLMGEVGRAASMQGITRQSGEAIAQALVEKYKHVFEAATKASPLSRRTIRSALFRSRSGWRSMTRFARSWRAWGWH